MSECGEEVQTVPDYNPLDDVLRTGEGAIDGSERPLDDYDYEEYHTASIFRKTEKVRAKRKKWSKERRDSRENTLTRNTSSEEEEGLPLTRRWKERRKRQAERKRAKKKA